MITMTADLKARIRDAQFKLRSLGFEHTSSIMDGSADRPGYLEFGMVYRKDRATIYLNHKTVDAILACYSALPEIDRELRKG